MNHHRKKYWQQRAQKLETSFQLKRTTWMSKVNIYTIIFKQQQANFSRGYLWPSFEDTAKLNWLVLLDVLLWQEFLTKETKEFKVAVSSVSTVKDYMMNEQSKYYRLFLSKSKQNFSDVSSVSPSLERMFSCITPSPTQHHSFNRNYSPLLSVFA